MTNAKAAIASTYACNAQGVLDGFVFEQDRDRSMKTSRRRSIFRIALGCSALLISVAACNKAPEAPPKTVEMTANDQMKFSVTNFEVQHGQKVTVTLKNIGTSPKASMGHNFTVLNKNVDWRVFVEKASTEAGNGYIPPNSEKEVIATTKLLGPGESDSVTFTAPFVPGEYDFVCTFPGHATQGMRGTMTVK
ncbi:MAG: plastocyanin/azurin family copper-binding protein [Verrucomicrobiota bacterium]|nr:plastocyanin/azurin family copper-binding protein [Verrucomicrobiota bacterium]